MHQEVLGPSRVVKILVDDREESYKMMVNDSNQIVFNFDNDQGTLIYDKGRLKMKQMSLELYPKQICSKTGWIDKSSQAIVCLPNELIVTFNGSYDSGLDIISF